MYKIRLSTKQKQRHYQTYLNRVQEAQGDAMLQDADKVESNKTDEAGQPEQTMQQIPIMFICPPGFEPKAFMIIAMDQHGKHYTNAPIHMPHLALRLGTIGLDFVSQRAVLHIQEGVRKQSPIIQPPPGMTVPPFRGPEGRS